MIQIAGDVNLPGWSGIVATLQNSLTIAGSMSGNTIVGNLNNLLPGQDLSQDIGILDLRWRNIFASSGSFDALTVNDTDLSNFGIPVDARPASGSIKPDADKEYDLGANGAEWASIWAESGIINLASLSNANIDTGTITTNLTIGGSAALNLEGNTLITGPVILSNGINFIPSPAHTVGIGSPGAPFAAMYAGSGVFDHLHPPAGSDPERIIMSGHFVPARDLVYELGSNAPDLRWVAVRAGSGIFSSDLTSAGSITGNSMTALTTLAAGTTITAGGNIDGNTMTANVVAFGVNFATNQLSLTRPEFSTVTAINTGSGLALRNENIWYDHLKANTEAIEITSLTMSMDSLTTRPYGVPIADANSVVLADHFAILTSHGGGTKDDWVIYLRRAQADGSFGGGSGIVASGTFGWDGAGDTVRKTWGRWATSGNVPVEFEVGSCYDVVIHNDGSGTVINAPVTRLSMGFRINANGPDLGRGE